MNEISYEERVKTYTNALIQFGDRKQMVKCVEELAECSQAICKVILGGENFDHLAEEIADATIMLEQMRHCFGLNEPVCRKMDEKILRLEQRLGDGQQCGGKGSDGER